MHQEIKKGRLMVTDNVRGETGDDEGLGEAFFWVVRKEGKDGRTRDAKKMQVLRDNIHEVGKILDVKR